MTFFRPEVHRHRSESWLGQVSLITPRVGWVLILMLLLAAVSILGLMAFGQYTRSETVSGQIVPDLGLIQVASSDPGVVTRLAIKEGDHVVSGQILAELSIERDSAQSGRVGEAVSRELSDQRARILQQLEDLDRTERAEDRRLAEKAASLQRQLTLSAAQIVSRERQRDGARELLTQIEPVRSSGQLTALQIHQFESAALEAETQLDLARLQHEAFEFELSNVESERLTLPDRMAVRRNELQHALAEVLASIARNDGARSVVLRAPVSGLVSGLNVRQGQSLLQGGVLLALVPQNSEFEAELWVPARAVGRIREGGRVAMRYDAFPFRQFGQQYGRIREISGRAMVPDNLPTDALNPIAPAYRVRVELDRQFVAHEDQRFQLRSNMSLQASLLLDRRRLIELTGLTLPAGLSSSESRDLQQSGGL